LKKQVFLLLVFSTLLFAQSLTKSNLELVDIFNMEFVTGGSGGRVLYADGTAFFSKYWFEKKPWEDPENYFKRSPLSYVANITTPIMLLTGEEDYRTPIAESEQFYTVLKLEGVETALVQILGASHSIANKPSILIAKIASVLTWFEKHKA